MTDLENKRKNQKAWYRANKDRAKATVKAWQENNSKRFKDKNKEWQQANKDRRKGNWLKLRYWPDLSWSEAIELYRTMLSKQNESCAICKRHRSQFKTDLCVDHSHTTDEIRGLLCRDCNSAMGLLKTDSGTTLLLNALAYMNNIPNR